MFLRATVRKKDGKEHTYWSVVENRRVAGGGLNYIGTWVYNSGGQLVNSGR